VLQDQHVVVVGGSAGIGLAVAKRALASGARVRIGSHDPTRLAAAVERVGGDLASATIDVTDDASTAAFFADCPPIDHLVFTAGDWVRRRTVPGPDFDIVSAQSAFDVRFWGLLRTINAALGSMHAKGSITLTGGLLAHRPQRGQALPSVVAGAVEHLARALALDLAPIRVNAVVPGLIATEVWAHLPSDRIDAMVRTSPLPRPGQPEEVAQAYIGLMENAYITGQSLIVDGGMALG